MLVSEGYEKHIGETTIVASIVFNKNYRCTCVWLRFTYCSTITDAYIIKYERRLHRNGALLGLWSEFTVGIKVYYSNPTVSLFHTEAVECKSFLTATLLPFT